MPRAVTGCHACQASESSETETTERLLHVDLIRSNVSDISQI